MLELTSPLPPDSKLAELAEDAYSPPYTWTGPGDERAKLTKVGDYYCVANQGTTKDGLSILRDLRACPWWNQYTGVSPAGFLKGALGMIDAMIFDLAEHARAGRVIFIGHSLGGAMGNIEGGIFTALGHPPAAVVTFEPARSGFWRLRRLLRQVPYAVYYDNGSQVPDVPPVYRHPTRRRFIGPPGIDPLDELGRIKLHRIAFIRQRMAIAGVP
ncbi:MAG: lipase family protein [Stellaceae bacterium]